MNVIEYFFWCSLGILIYTYLGYGGMLYILSIFWKKSVSQPLQPDVDLPPVTFIIAAYNESDFIKEKLSNTLSLDYPADKLNVFVVTDGSTDNTPDLVSNFPGVELYHQPARRGKIHAVNRVMKLVRTPITVFSDANTFLNKEAIKNMIRHYSDPKVGGVSGEKKIVEKREDNAPGSGEGLYWRYESFLKKMDSRIYTMVGSAGELFSVRTHLYEAPPENTIIEDFYISLVIVKKGYRFIYESKAMATETASATILDEWKRKVRISAGGLQAIGKLAPLLNPFRYGIVSFQYISHRVLRWTLAPLSLLVVFSGNLYLCFSDSRIYQLFMIGQIAFYGLALAGYRWQDKKVAIKGFFIPFYFTIMNASVFAGFIRFLSGKQSVVWEKTKRTMN